MLFAERRIFQELVHPMVKIISLFGLLLCLSVLLPILRVPFNLWVDQAKAFPSTKFPLLEIANILDVIYYQSQLKQLGDQYRTLPQPSQENY